MDAGLAGLQQALGQAGIALTENGPQVVASDAIAPPNTQAVEVDPSVSPPAAPQPATATDNGDERMSLDEYAAALAGQEAPETGVETAATPEAAPEQVFTARELELQQKLAEYEAKEAEYEVWDKIAVVEDAYAAQAEKGRIYWEQTVPNRIKAEAQNRGLSDLEVAQAMVVVKDRQRIWDLTLEREKAQNPALRPEHYSQPALVDQLVTQYGLSADDKTVLQKYASNPEMMKDFAATLGSRIQAHTQTINTTVKQAQTQARQERAQDLIGGITPSAPNVSPHKLPPNFKDIPNEQGAAFFAGLVRQGALKARP